MCSRELRETIINQKNGQLVRITYKSDMTSKLKADVRHAGVEVMKIVNVTSRTGVKYDNIARVIEKKKDNPGQQSVRKNPYEWVVPNKIKKHIESGKEYLVLAPIGKNSNAKSKYIVKRGTDVKEFDSIDNIKDLLIPSALNGEAPSVITVGLDNVIAFGSAS